MLARQVREKDGIVKIVLPRNNEVDYAWEGRAIFII
jgi:hypothetical protein